MGAFTLTAQASSRSTCGGMELGLTDDFGDVTMADLTRLPVVSAEDQSSSGRKMCGATHALQIGVAASRSPRGIGTLRSG